MSIPDKFGRIVKHKLGELKDWFDQVDDEREERESAEILRRRDRSDARRELDDALKDPLPPSGSRPDRPAPPSSLPRRTPEEIARGQQQGVGRAATSGGAAGQVNAPDPLDYHYRLFKLEPGADFAAVQAEYNKLAARCEPSRFPAGSPEESQAREIRQRIDASFKALRDVLDTTARRFDLLEFDTPIPPPNIGARLDKESSRASNLEI
jgi:hypothetical protein